MTKVSLFKQDGTQAGEVTLNDAVFGIEPNEAVLFDVVLSQRASLRHGFLPPPDTSERFL